MMGGEGPSDFFGSEILAKSVFSGSMKNAGMFLGCKKRTKGYFWVKKRTKGVLVMLKTVVIFLGRRILKL